MVGGGVVVLKTVAFLVLQSDTFGFWLLATLRLWQPKFFLTTLLSELCDFCWLTSSDMPPQICHVLFSSQDV